MARINSRSVGETESHRGAERPDLEGRSNITLAEVPPTGLSNMVEVYPYDI